MILTASLFVYHMAANAPHSNVWYKWLHDGENPDCVLLCYEALQFRKYEPYGVIKQKKTFWAQNHWLTS
jgi:hypothetical protein